MLYMAHSRSDMNNDFPQGAFTLYQASLNIVICYRDTIYVSFMLDLDEFVLGAWLLNTLKYVCEVNSLVTNGIFVVVKV